MNFNKKIRTLLVLLCILVSVMAMIGSLKTHLQRKGSKNTINEVLTSLRTTKNDLFFNTFAATGVNRNLTEGQRGTINVTTLPPIIENGTILIDRRIAEEVSKKVRVLCWIPTREIYRDTRLMAINSTWARRCDKTIYFMTSPEIKQDDVVNVLIHDSRNTLTDKTVYAHKYIYRYYLDDFDWFLKADDDTYVIMENLKLLLSKFDLKVPGYVGCQFKHYAPQGYMSGGAGYAFNSVGLKTLVEKGYRIPKRCRLSGGAEDIETGRCAYKAGVRTLDQLDVMKKQTFFPSNIYSNLLGPVPDWAISYSRAKITTGLSCCSPLVVSFHYSGPKLMFAMEFLLYRVVVHGRREVISKAEEMFDGSDAVDMTEGERRRPYPGEKLEDYYKPEWREKDTTIYNHP